MRCSRLLLSFAAAGLAAGNEHTDIAEVTATVTITKTVADPAAISAALSSLSSLNSELQPPASLASLIYAIPSSVQAAFANPNPAALSSVVAGFATGIPSWYADLPRAAQSYLLDVGPKALTIQPVLLSLEAVAGITITPWNHESVTGTAGGNGSSWGTAGSVKSMTTSGLASQTSTEKRNASSSSSSGPPEPVQQTKAPSTTVSSAEAAKQTGVLAGGFVAAMGVFCLALAL